MNQPDNIPPTTVEQAVATLIADLPLKEQLRIAGKEERRLMDIYFTFSVDIEDKFRIFENHVLLESCRSLAGDKELFAEEAVLIIITELWKRLRQMYPSAGLPD
jgi:hypothetical protein